MTDTCSADDALQAGWGRLAAARAVLPMQDPDWVRSCVEAFGPTGTVELLTVHEGDELTAVAPMLRRRGHLELLGGETYEPGDVLAAGPAALDELCGALCRRGLPLSLHRIPQDSSTIPALRRALGARGHLVVRSAPGTPLLELGPAWTGDLGAGLSAHRRSDLRRAERHADAEGAVTVRLLRPALADTPALLNEAFAIEARSWKGEAGTALGRDRRLGTFFRDFAPRLAADGRLELAFLDIGGRGVAMQIAVEWHERLWLLKTGYDDAFSGCSPGILLLAHAVREAAERGLEAFEFLGTVQPWLDPWTTRTRDMSAVSAYPLHARAVPGVVRDAAIVARRPAARAAAKDLARRPVRAAARRAHSRYVAGPALEDACRLEAIYAQRGFPTIIGFWNVGADSVQRVLGEYRASLEALAHRADAQISIKVTALGERPEPVAELLRLAAPARTGVHIDAMAPETQDAALDIACGLAADGGGLLGCTLTGRWPRSIADAPRVAAAGLNVRVVKSEWPSPEAPDHDPRRGYLDVVAALCAARPPFVEVATHDVPLADRALRMLLEAGVPCEHQVLHGMKAQGAMDVARALGVPTRILVPYGTGRLPYSARAALRDPRAAARLARDLTRRTRPL